MTLERIRYIILPKLLINDSSLMSFIDHVFYFWAKKCRKENEAWFRVSLESCSSFFGLLWGKYTDSLLTGNNVLSPCNHGGEQILLGKVFLRMSGGISASLRTSLGRGWGHVASASHRTVETPHKVAHWPHTVPAASALDPLLPTSLMESWVCHHNPASSGPP